MTPYFNILAAWNGTSEKMDRKRSYHPTVSVPDPDKREIKAGTQDAIVLEAMSRLRQGTGSSVHANLSGALLITSVRRALSNLADRGLLRRDVAVPGPAGHPEAQYVFP